MTDQEINIAMAEACGWQIHPKDRFIVIPPNSPHSVQPLSTIPSYTADLNAMHEAVLAMPQDWQDRFTIELTRHCGSHKLAVNASARQRAEMFLHTLAKWPVTKQAAFDKSSQ